MLICLWSISLFFIFFFFFEGYGDHRDLHSFPTRRSSDLTVVPDHLRGRLVAISSMFFLGGPYLGQVESGVAADLVSPMFSVVSGGLVTLLSVVGVALWAPEVVSYRTPAPELKRGA